MKKSKHVFARVISYAFHPLFMPFLGLAFFYFSKQINGFNMYAAPLVHKDNITILSITFLCSLVVPGFFVFLLKKYKKIESYHMYYKEERLLPFSIMAMSFFSAYYLIFDFLAIQAEPIIKVFYFGCLFSIIGALLITVKWKISIHMIGIGGFTGAVFLLNYFSNTSSIIALTSALFISGLIGYSRLTLKAHSIKQVMAGFALGFISETLFLFLI
jgi:hypothetical protein